jgi:hypothetical protein
LWRLVGQPSWRRPGLTLRRAVVAGGDRGGGDHRLCGNERDDAGQIRRVHAQKRRAAAAPRRGHQAAQRRQGAGAERGGTPRNERLVRCRRAGAGVGQEGEYWRGGGIQEVNGQRGAAAAGAGRL